jgi:hypothetical protein
LSRMAATISAAVAEVKSIMFGLTVRNASAILSLESPSTEAAIDLLAARHLPSS